MHFATMNTADLATFLRNAHLEATDGLTAEIRAAGAEKYTAARVYLAAQPKPSWRK